MFFSLVIQVIYYIFFDRENEINYEMEGLCLLFYGFEFCFLSHHNFFDREKLWFKFQNLEIQ
jgi:hypothetical protein